MRMHNPTHPGKFIKRIYLDPAGLSNSGLAEALGVSTSTVSRLIAGNASVSPDMALRLSAVLGRTPQSWLAMQSNYSLWKAEQEIDMSKLQKLELVPA